MIKNCIYMLNKTSSLSFVKCFFFIHRKKVHFHVTLKECIVQSSFSILLLNSKWICLLVWCFLLIWQKYYRVKVSFCKNEEKGQSRIIFMLTKFYYCYMCVQMHMSKQCNLFIRHNIPFLLCQADFIEKKIRGILREINP